LIYMLLAYWFHYPMINKEVRWTYTTPFVLV
jgi:hypothetical protein